MNIDSIPDARLGAVVRGVLRARKSVRAAAIKADEKEVAQYAQERDAVLAEQAKKERPALFIKGYIVRGVKSITIPALDCRDVILDEIATAVARSPYNKARFTLGMPILDPETTTWRALMVEHIEMRERINRPAIAAELDEDTQIKTIMRVMDLTESEARVVLARTGK